MNYLGYIRSIAIGFVVGLILFALAVIAQAGTPTEGTRWTSEIYEVKNQISQKLPSPKLVLVGGSNVLFGISCAHINEQMNYPCLNGGTYAGLGTEYILKRAQKWLKPEDTVLIALEYESYGDNGDLKSSLIDHVFSRDLDYFKEVDTIQQLKLFFGISLPTIKNNLIARYRPEKKWKSFYNSKNINEFGDETSNLKSNIKTKQKKALNALKPQKPINNVLSSYGTRKIKDFVQWCREKGVKVLATWPNQIWFDEYATTRQAEWRSIKELYASIGVPLLGEQKDFKLDKFLFFDTHYHLNNEGVRVRTGKLMEFLKPYLS